MFLCTESGHSAIVEYCNFFSNIWFFFKSIRYASNWILKMTFWGQTKTGQKLAAGWTGLACISKSHCGNKISFILFAISSSSRLEKSQTMERLFVVFHHSRKMPCLSTYGWPDICRLHRCKHEKSGGFVGQIMT